MRASGSVGEETDRPLVVLTTDGSCKQQCGHGGWAALLQCGNDFQIHFGNARGVTNNRMELQAVVEGLEELRTPCDVQVHSDSRYVVDGTSHLLDRWIENDWRKSNGKPVANRDLWERVHDMRKKHHITPKWIRGHNGHSENELVDDFATSSCRLPV